MTRMILHLDMDAFFASVEQAVNPAYAGKPLIVGSRHRQYNTVVAACSYEAKACGIHSGMSTREAFQLCPQALFVPADSAKYVYTSDTIAQILRVYTDKGERASVDEFFLDAGGMSPAQAEAMAHEIKARIKKSLHITGSVGIAPTRILAKMAAKRKKPDGLLVVEKKEVLDFLRDIPVEAVPGIGPSLKGRLNLLSVFTCGQLHALDLEFLSERFGKVGTWLWGISRLQDGYEIRNWESEDVPPKSVGHSYTLEKDVCRLDSLKIWIRLLAEMVAYRLRRDDLQAQVVHFYMSDREGFYSREKKFYSPTFDPEEIYRRCLIILKTFGLKTICARALGVSVSCLLPAERHHLFEKDRKREQLLCAVDRINERFGDWSICPAVLK